MPFMFQPLVHPARDIQEAWATSLAGSAMRIVSGTPAKSLVTWPVYVIAAAEAGRAAVRASRASDQPNSLRKPMTSLLLRNGFRPGSGGLCRRQAPALGTWNTTD